MDSEEKQTLNDKENQRIECKSKHSINYLLQQIKEQFEAYYIHTKEGSEVDTEAFNRKIYQTFKKAFLSNVLVDGQVVNESEEDDPTSEFEPIDTEKEHFIQNDLMNRFDQQLGNTTYQRKTGPHTMKSHMKKIIRPELKYLAVVNVVLDKEGLTSSDTDQVEKSTQEDVETRLGQTTSTIESTKQCCDETLIKSKDLLQALKLYEATEKSETYRVMWETPPQTQFAKPGNRNSCLDMCGINKRLLP